MNQEELTPTEFCEKQRHQFIGTSTPESRKRKGQFFTPLKVAQFMARLATVRKEKVKMLDPGAGTGMLTCAVCERLGEMKNWKEIQVNAFENDLKLVELLNQSLEYTKKWLEGKSIGFTYSITSEDFVLTNARTIWSKELSTYDLAVGNPPYFKISKNDPRAQLTRDLVYGQPNIYALFMGVTAELLRNKGVMVFITPRSYTAGLYFKAFRKRFFDVMRPERVHIFQSRKDAFRADEVLQENIILRARKKGSANTVGISVSQEASDVYTSKSYRIPLTKALPLTKG